MEFDLPLELGFYEVTDGVFGAPVLPESYWGTITITLSDCDTGRVEFDGLDGLVDGPGSPGGIGGSQLQPGMTGQSRVPQQGL